MNFMKKALVVLAVFALFSAFLISQGKWESAVVEPIAAVFGGDAADNVDQFGQRTNEVAGPALDLSGKMLDGYFSDSGEANNDVALQVLDTVPELATARIPDYDRELFGTPWSDVDGNGCNTRDDILARDLVDIILDDDSCTVLSGVLADPYTGDNIDFERGAKTSGAVPIDHIFALSSAWEAGAHSWTDQKRLEFANDPDNLLAVDGPTNSSKSDKTPAYWLPENTDFECTYVAQYVYVASTYSLGISSNDRSTMSRILKDC